MKILDRFRVLVGKEPKIKKGKRFRYLDESIINPDEIKEFLKLKFVKGR